MTPKQLSELRKAAEKIKAWKLGDAWLDTTEDESAAVVGNIDEDGREFPVVIVDCDQYFQGQDSLPLAKFYAAANPEAIISLLDYVESLERDAARYRYLRDDGEGFDISVLERDTEDGELWVHGYPPEELDDAIDAAMGESK